MGQSIANGVKVMDIFNVLTLIGGLSLFLFGMSLMGQALERRAGGRTDGRTGARPRRLPSEAADEARRGGGGDAGGGGGGRRGPARRLGPVPRPQPVVARARRAGASPLRAEMV